MSEANTFLLFDRSASDWKCDTGKPVRSKDDLHSLLLSRANGPPCIFELISPEGSSLLLGLGGAYACAQFNPRDRQTSYDARAGVVSHAGDLDFLLGSTPTPVGPEYCLSVEEAIQIAKFLFETSTMDPKFQWDEG